MCLFPDVMLDSAYDVPYEALVENGFRTVLLDIDNTIVTHGAEADEKAKKLFERIKNAGLCAVLVSNNRKERVKPFADAVGVRYLHKAGKPKKSGCLKAVRMAKGVPGQTFFVGDQIYTDIWGANAAGLKTILTKPIDPREEIQIVLKRIIEKPVIALFRLKVRRTGYRDNAFARIVREGVRKTREEGKKL